MEQVNPVVQSTGILSTCPRSLFSKRTGQSFHARLKGAFERGGLSNLAWSFLGREFTRASCCLCAEPTEAVAVRVVYLCSRCELEDVGHGSHLLCDSCGDPWSSSIHYFYCEDHAKPLMED